MITEHWGDFGCLAEYREMFYLVNTEDCILLDKVSDYKLMTEINSESVCGLLCFYVCVFSTHAEMMPDSPYRTQPVLQSIEPSHRHRQGMCLSLSLFSALESSLIKSQKICYIKEYHICFDEPCFKWLHLHCVSNYQCFFILVVLRDNTDS